MRGSRCNQLREVSNLLEKVVKWVDRNLALFLRHNTHDLYEKAF